MLHFSETDNRVGAAGWSGLAARIDGEVHGHALFRYMLSTDGSIFQREPAAVVYPRHTGDVVQAIRFARENGFAIHPRGAGSGLCGSALGAGIVIDFTRFMNRLVHLDAAGKTVTCEPGYRFGELEAALAGSGLFFPPDPSSGEYATFGGMFATNASGAHSVKYGNVSDYIVDAEVVLADGRVITLSDISSRPCDALSEPFQALFRLFSDNAGIIAAGYPEVRNNVAGYNLRDMVRGGRLYIEKLLAGAEGTLGVVTRLSLRLIDRPAFESLVVAFFEDIVSASRATQEILPMGPSGIEVMDKSLLNLARDSDARLRDKIPAGIDNVLLIEFDASAAADCAAQAAAARDRITELGLTRQAHLAVSAEEKARFWAVRKAAVPILYRLKGEKKILALIEDAVVPTDRLVDYFNGIYAILNRRGVSFVTYGHIAKGLLHTRPLMNLKDARDVGLLRVLADDVHTLVSSLGGSVSGEHGDGRLRSAYIRRMYPDLYPLMLEVKRIFDPENHFNPEIKTVSDPDQMTRLLRYGASYRATDLPDKALNWPEGFVAEAEKCHGCSKCTTVTTATRMCPIYKFTREESAAPKAKANLLRGLISGAVSDRALYDRTFQSVMDQCVMCGSCRHECPSHVNIPKLAAEAKAQYVRRFGASIENRVLTSLELAGRLTRKLSPVSRPLMERPLLRRAVDRAVGISSRRDRVVFPPRSFFERVRAQEGQGDISVLYYAGCYAGYVRPEIGEAVVRVLTHMGMTVLVPDQLCCGLPMLSKGMAREARDKVARNLARWGVLAARVDHVAVSCSSCGYALMADWADLTDADAATAIREKVIHITHLIREYRDRLRLKTLSQKAVYHQPCHLRIQPGAGSSLELLSELPGLAIADLNSHCCGMIGSWGMSAAHFDLSREIGSLMIGRLNAADAQIGVTDCPTCRMQMEQFGRKPIRHPVEVVAARLKFDKIGAFKA